MPTPIFLVVYDLGEVNYYTYFFGLGAYHTTIHVLNNELSFGYSDEDVSGILILDEYESKNNPFYQYRETILLGLC